MALVDELRKTLYSARAISGQLGFRTHTVAIVNVGLQGTHTGDGARAEWVTPITEAGGQPPKVRWLKDDERALGNMPAGTIAVGPITPAFTGGGTDLALLKGRDLTQGEVRTLRVTGPVHPDGYDYTIVAIKADKALNYVITAVPVGTPDP